MNGIKRTLIISALVALPTSGVLASPQPYMGIEAGAQNGLKFDDQKEVQTKNKNLGWAGRLYAGYLWQTSESLQYGIETGFNLHETLGISAKNAQGGLDMKLARKAVDLLGVANYEVSPKWNIFGKGGVAYLEQKSTFNSTDIQNGMIKRVGLPIEQNKLLPKAVLGVGYKLSEKQSLGLSYSRTFGHDKAATSVNKPHLLGINTLMMGWQYNF